MPSELILVVEDNPTIRVPLAKRLAAEGYGVVTAGDGVEALEQFQARQPDLVILDLMLPRKDGITVCREIRGLSRVPILILSARSEEENVVAGLEVGADDYVVKPFRLNELLARVKAQLRRGELGASPEEGADRVLRAGPLELDLGGCIARVGKREVTLTPIELRLLAELIRRRGEVLSRQELLQAVWRYDGYDPNLINTHVKRLRERIEENPSEPRVIQTVRGFGYRIAV